MRFRGACLGCACTVVENAVHDLRVSPLLDSHAHDGRYGLPGHDLLFSEMPALRLRCAVDGKRTRKGAAAVSRWATRAGSRRSSAPQRRPA